MALVADRGMGSLAPSFPGCPQQVREFMVQAELSRTKLADEI